MSLVRSPVAALALCALAFPLEAQVALDPPTLVPATWERISVRVINQTDTAWVAVRVEVPDVIGILGVDVPDGWAAETIVGTGTSPQAIEWRGGRVERGGFEEFAFMGRLQADVRQKVLYFPVRLTRAGGTEVNWRRGGEGPELRIAIAGSTQISSWAAFALAGAAFGLAALAVILSLRRERVPHLQ